MRKVTGSRRSQLVAQFWQSQPRRPCGARPRACLVWLCLPAFNRLVGKERTLGCRVGPPSGSSRRESGPSSASPPACTRFSPSGFQPVRVLKGLVASTRCLEPAYSSEASIVTEFTGTVRADRHEITVYGQTRLHEAEAPWAQTRQVVMVLRSATFSADSTGHSKQSCCGTRNQWCVARQPRGAEPPSSPEEKTTTCACRALVSRPHPRPKASPPRATSCRWEKYDFLETLEIPLVRGRSLRPEEF